jgi:protein Mpv17
MNDQLDGSNREGPLTLSAMTQEWMDSIQNMDTEELLEKAMNACLLLVAFGFSFYTMVTIDHEFTRGWTQQEIAMRIPLDNWASYESALAEKPIITKTFINVVIYSLGDWLSQTVFQKKNVLEFDVSRTLRNGFIGLCFGPLVHMYYEWSDTILPVEGGLMNRVQKVFMDQTLYLTIKCSMYIAAVGILQGDDLKTVKETIQDRIGPICFTAWKFWPLIHCVTYGVIPGRHRMLWVNCVDLVWNAILASMTRKEEPLAMEGVVDVASVDVAAMEMIPATTVEHLVDGEVFLMEQTSDSSNVTQPVLM